MPDFTKRSYEPEMLDAKNIPKELLFQNLRELDLVNRRLGGHAVSLKGIKQLVRSKDKTYHIVDIGCGGGDAMKQIASWAKKNSYKVRLTGVDMNADCIAFMKSACSGFPEIHGVVADYRDYLNSVNDVDIIHCSLFCHHLDEVQLTELFKVAEEKAGTGCLVNDLQRHWFAYYSIKFLTRLLNGSSLVKNDAPLSVLRGFHRAELEARMKEAGMNRYTITWAWAFRYLIVSKKN
jgi:SAM-dependent methyltransferase